MSDHTESAIASDTREFKYYGGGTEADLIARSGQTVTVLHQLGPDAVDPEVGAMYQVRFADGFQSSVFAEELI